MRASEKETVARTKEKKSTHRIVSTQRLVERTGVKDKREHASSRINSRKTLKFFRYCFVLLPIFLVDSSTIVSVRIDLKIEKFEKNRTV